MPRFIALRFITPALLLLAISSRSFAADPAPPPSLAIRIRLPNTKTPPVLDSEEEFDVILTNTSSQPLRIWKPSCKNGQYSVSFQMKNTRTGQIHNPCIRPDIDPRYWGNGTPAQFKNDSEESTAEIAPHDSYVTRVMFKRKFYIDNAWINLPYPDDNDRYEIVAQFESKKDKDSSGHVVWTGKVHSPPVIAPFTSNQPRTPFSDLEAGYTEEALKTMAANPQKWLAATDRNYTLLHSAARDGGNVAVVKWLLEHGANTRAQVENQATPIDLAHNPAVIDLILKKDDNFVRDNEPHLQQLLHEAAKNLAIWRNNKQEQEHWTRIVQVYLDNGLEEDLLVAIYRDNLKKVKQILEAHPEQAKSFADESPLRAAAYAGRLEICRHLLENFEVDVNDWNGGMGTPLIVEALQYPEIVKLLIEHDVDLQTRIFWRGNLGGAAPLVGDDATVLHHAAEKGTPETVQLLLEHGLNIFATAQGDFGNNPHQFPLEIAAEVSQGDNAKAILNHPSFLKSDPGIRQAILDKSLRLALAPHDLHDNHTQPSAIIPLLEKGANPNASHKSLTLIQRAAETFNRREHPSIIDAFKKHGAILDLPTAAAIGDLDEVRTLLKKDPKSVNTLNPNGEAPLHLAASRGFMEIVTTLLAAGADVNIRTKPLPKKKPDSEDEETDLEEDDREPGWTPLNFAVGAQNFDVAQTLIHAGADVNARTQNEEAPLHHAAWNQDIRTARLLLKKGAKLDFHRKSDGATPLEVYREVAKYNDGPDLAQLFFEFQPPSAK